MTTPRLPVPGSDDGTWGTLLNAYLGQEHGADGSLMIRSDGTLTARVAKAGDTMTGTLTLAADPTSGLHAATKQYVDSVAPVAATAVKTSAYSADANQLVPVNASSAAITVTLPSTPADKSRVIIKKIDSSSNVVSIATSGPDVIDKTGGGTSLALSLQNQAVAVQYAGASNIWYVISDELPLSQLDARYGVVFNTQLMAWVYVQAFRLVSVSRDSNGAFTTASVVWPDGATGTLTSDVVSIAFPGAVDAYHVTYENGSTTKTLTQPTITRDSAGRISAQPAVTIA